MITTSAAMVPLPLPPTFSAKGGRTYLNSTSSLLPVPEGRASSFTLGSLLSLADNNYRRHRLDCLRDVSECLRIDQSTGS